MIWLVIFERDGEFYHLSVMKIIITPQNIRSIRVQSSIKPFSFVNYKQEQLA